MDKKEAAKILARKLVKANGQKFILEPAYKKHLLETAVYHCYIEHCKPFSSKTGNYWTYSEKYVLADDVHKRGVESHKKKIMEYCSEVSDANYVFVEHSENVNINERYSLFSFTDIFSFFALIGQEEERDLKRRFYKDVPLEIVCAMDTLGIKHFADIYKVYCSDEFFDSLETLKVGKEFSDFVSRLRYDSDDEVKVNAFDQFGGVDTLNARLKKLGLSSFVSTTARRKSDAEKYPCFVHRDNLLDVAAQLRNCELCEYKAHEGFFDFVFSLPYEEQDIKANKTLLKLLDGVDACGIILNEYSKDKLFKDYFAVLDEKCRKEVVNGMKALPSRNKFLDSWLFKEGFDIDVDYLKLYKEDTEGFIRYFKYNSIEVRKLIISDLLGYEYVNPKVIEFLEKEHSNLLRDTAFNDK